MLLALGALAAGAWTTTDMFTLRDTAYSLSMTTDKVTGAADPIGHEYHVMYGLFLLPVLQRAAAAGSPTKLFEIGLGCGMQYGAGASALLWRKLLPATELWEADFDARCLIRHKKQLADQGVHTVAGDQSSNSTLSDWIRKSGGGFDAIIDDGSHQSQDILTSFWMLWPQLKPGGTYFIEDLQISRDPKFDNTRGNSPVMDVLQSWMDQVVIPNLRAPKGTRPSAARAPLAERQDETQHLGWIHWNKTASNERTVAARIKFPAPPGLAFVFCQADGCALGKKPKLPAEAEALGATLPPSSNAQAKVQKVSHGKRLQGR